MNKNEILEEIKIRSGETCIRLPRDIQIEEGAEVTTISLPARSVIKNMQDNAAAFEGWIICLKAIMPDWAFCLHWEIPEKINNAHYQRFVYRVAKFDDLFGGKTGWFSIGDESSLGALKTKSNKQNYLLNYPSTTPKERTNRSRSSAENLLENKLVKAQPKSLLGLFHIPEGQLYRQLPMGVFDREISKETAIFTGGSSAADLWGTPEDESLVLFELKVKNNNQVGVISELFFYAMVLADEQQGKFFRKGVEGEIIRNTKSLKAMILAPGIHPLITKKVFQLLNDNIKGIEFGYVAINPSPPFDCKRMF